MERRFTKRNWKTDGEGHTQAYRKLAEYEDLEEQGLMVKLPCKVGDKVYLVHSPFGNIDEWEITDIQIGNVNLFRLRHEGTDDYAAICGEELGDRAFLIRAEAEKKLAELKGARK